MSQISTSLLEGLFLGFLRKMTSSKNMKVNFCASGFLYFIPFSHWFTAPYVLFPFFFWKHGPWGDSE